MRENKNMLKRGFMNSITILIRIGEGILKEAKVAKTKEAGISLQDKDNEAPEVALTCRTLLFSNGSIHKRVACFLLNRKTKKSLSRNKAERMCCIYPGTVLEIKNEINKIFREETQILFKSGKMRKVFKE